MNQKLDLFQIKKDMESYVGGKIKLRANRGRKKSFVREGVLAEMHPSIFVVRFDDEADAERRMSFTYIDILTKAVEIVKTKEERMEVEVS